MNAKRAGMMIMACCAMGLASQAVAQNRLAYAGDTYGTRRTASGYDSVDDYFADRGYTRDARRNPPRERALSFLLDIAPMGALSSPNMDGFETTRTVGLTTETEDLDGTGSYMPAMHIGLGINNRVLDVDLLVGAGFISNSAFGASFAELAIAPRFRIGEHFRIGPFISAMSFGDADWHGDSDIDIRGGSGSRVGMSMCFGGQKAYFKTTITYADFDFDVDDTDADWAASKETIDMAGWALQMGVYFRF